MKTYDRIRNIRTEVKSDEMLEFGRLNSKAFTRNRKMNFEDYCWFILNKRGITLKMEIENYVEKMNKEVITESAICQQRKNLNPLVFKKLNESYVRNIYENEKVKTVKEYLILAIDGSDLEIPNVQKLKEEYGEAKNQKENRTTAKATASFIYDTLNEIILTSNIDKYKTSERELAKRGIEEIERIIKNRKVIIVFDRGYPSLELMNYLEEKGIKYIIRINKIRYKEEITSMHSKDEKVDIKIESTRLYNIKDKKIKEKLKKEKKYTIRIVKYQLESEEEVLATNLEIFSTEEIGKLYFKRWKIETAYGIAKNKLNIENISGQSRIIVEQEFYASVLMQNIMSDIKNEANEKIEKKKKEKAKKYEYKINTNILIGKLRKKFIEIAVDTSEEGDKEYNKLIEEIQRYLVPIRENRKNPRRKLSYRVKYRQNQKRNI